MSVTCVDRGGGCPGLRLTGRSGGTEEWRVEGRVLTAAVAARGWGWPAAVAGGGSCVDCGRDLALLRLPLPEVPAGTVSQVGEGAAALPSTIMF